ncbi:MAG: PVC-type heme-binding CxxCH protein, partial [Planctomycetota bacterium]
MNTARTILFAAILLPAFALGQSIPEVLAPDFELIEFAKTPEIVTPIGAAFDDKGRLLVIESHTHKTPSEYDGPKSDRIRILEDTDDDGRSDQFRTYYEGTTHTMSLRQGEDGWLYVATRAKVFRIRDSDGDDQADEEQTLVHLETEGDYPHNGLSGLALDGKGHLYFGMGENLGRDYRMIGSDKQAQRGSGEGGVFRSDLDGKNLTRIATGFWNPFGICFDPHGRIFAVGNDADGRPPCRLVQVVETGDYGYQFKFGRSGRHPLQAWNGELPGTLPMAAATGEAPCEIAAYRGQLWVAVWGDYRIERYTPTVTGATVTATREVVVQGDHTFRPVALTESPDGSLYFTDWIDKSYPVHGKGRVWRLKPKAKSDKKFPELTEAERTARLAASGDVSAILESVKSDDVFQRQHAVAGINRTEELTTLTNKLPGYPQGRLAFLQSIRWTADHALAEADPVDVELLNMMLVDSDEAVRVYATRWVADAKVLDATATLQSRLKSSETSQEFMATLAAISWLKDEKLPDTLATYLDSTLKGKNTSEEVKIMAVRLLGREPNKPLPPEIVALVDGEAGKRLQKEAIRTVISNSPKANASLHPHILEQ